MNGTMTIVRLLQLPIAIPNHGKPSKKDRQVSTIRWTNRTLVLPFVAAPEVRTSALSVIRKISPCLNLTKVWAAS